MEEDTEEEKEQEEGKEKPQSNVTTTRSSQADTQVFDAREIECHSSGETALRYARLPSSRR